MVGIVIYFGHNVCSPPAALEDKWIIDEPKVIQYVNGFLHQLYFERQYAKTNKQTLKYANMKHLYDQHTKGSGFEEINKTLAATPNCLFAGRPSKSN